MSSVDYLDLCRLCLVKDRVSVPIFEGEGDVRQIFLKIAACLPVKVAREDELPKKICDDCVYKVELLYQFWNTTANAEKQLLQWLNQVGLEDKQGYVTGVLNPSTMKQEESGPAVGLGGVAPMQVSGAQPGIGIGVIDNMGLGMPIIITGATQQQLTTTVPMDTSSVPIQPVHQALPGPSNQPGHEQLSQTQTNSSARHQDDEEDTSEEEENSDDDCDADDGLPVKEESEEDPGNSRTIEPTTFVNVSLACDEPGPSGLQQQKIAEIPEMSMPQNVDGDPKSGLKKPKEESEDRKPETKQRGQRKLDDNLKKDEDHSKTKIIVKKNSNSSERNGRVLVIVDSILEDSNAEVSTIKIRDEDPLHVDNETEFLELLAAQPINESWKCDHCDRICGNRDLLRRHKIVHSREFKYSCDICEKKFKRSSELKVHGKLTHSKEKNYICDICSSAFKLKSQLTIHTKRHNNQYDFSCEICQKGFHTRGDYKSHKFTKHGISSHVCSVCGKGFRTKSNLNKHTRIHQPDYEPERPHQCEMCGKMFATKKSLKIHGNTHTGEKNYSCDQCGKTVRTRASLRDHMMLHTGQKPVVCRYCKKGFTKRSTMTVHMRIHTGERPHKCDTCQKTFTQRTSLVIHRRYHTGERPYQCPTCSKGFVSSAQLKLHQNSSC